MKILVLGAGQVATAVGAMTPLGRDVVAWSRSHLDIVDAAAVHGAVGSLKPDWIVNAAAYTAVDLAEEQRAQAVAVNDTAVDTLVQVAAHNGSSLLHLSTDFVFDGRSGRAYLTTDSTNPLSVYGKSKRDGEMHVLAYPKGRVLRTSWVYGSTGKNFVLTMLRLMREKPSLSIVSDQIGSPTWATGLARAIWGMIDGGVPAGLYHWADLGIASWYDFAVAVQEESLQRSLLQKEVPILPISSAQYPTRAKRPAFSVLDTTSTRAQINSPARHWRQHLRMMLDELRSR